ncbi:TPA: DUF1642 domain-containing protein [Enterococcus faecium]
MNKQKLIDKYTAEISRLRPYCPNRHLISEQLKYDLYKETLEDLKQLDEPQKHVMPKFVADWFEDNKHALDLAIFTKIRELDGKRYPHETDFENWLDNAENNPIETLIRMKDGYEVEKEPLYYVKLPVVYFNHLDLETYLMKDDRGNITIADNNDFDDMKFTESEIKAIDERYWAFAVPVEEVAEG